MTTFLLAVVLIAVSMGALALGVMAGRKPIAGSCGGVGCISGVECGACSRSCGVEGAAE